MKKIYDKQGNLFAELNYSKNYYLDYNKHSHEGLALSVFSFGDIEVTFHDLGQFKVNSNQIIVYNPQQVHLTKSKKNNVKDYYTLHVNKQWCTQIQNDILDINTDFVYLENIIDDNSIKNELYGLFEKINNGCEFELNSLKSILKNILKKYMLKNKDKIQKEHLLLNKVENYIIENLNNSISLGDISKAVAYDESYITRIFKKKYGLTPHSYIINKRVQKAKNKLLNSKDISLSELSNEVGFYDQSHFSKVFKKVYAITPNKYREN